jgi:hypothetical protein
LPNNLQNDDESEVMDLDYDDALAFFESGEFQDAMHSLQISYESGNNETVKIFNQILFKNFGNIEWNDETWNFLKNQAEDGKSFAHLAFFYKLKGNKETYHMNHPYQGLYVGTGVWRTLEDFSSGAVCLVLASEFFDEEEYIYDYDEFIRLKKSV